MYDDLYSETSLKRTSISQNILIKGIFLKTITEVSPACIRMSFYLTNSSMTQFFFAIHKTSKNEVSLY